MNFKNIRNSHVLWLSIGLIAVLYLISLYNRSANNDEGMIAEWAYWIINKGYARSTLMEPLGVGFENRITVYHKLIAWISIPSIYVWGMQLFPLKLIIFFFFLVTIITAFRYAKHNNPQNSIWFFICFILLYSLNARVFEFALTFRPEIMLSAFGFLSFFFLKKSIDYDDKKTAALSGLFSGLAFLTHLNGVSYLMSGFFLLIFLKKYKHLFWYTFTGSIIALFYFADMLDTNIVQAILHDLLNSPDVKDNNFTIWLPLIKLINEQQRFFHSPLEVSLSILFILSLFFSKKEFFKTHKILLIYISLIFIFLGSLTTGKNPKYLLVFVPFIVTIITHFILSIKNISSIKKYVFYSFGIVYFLIQGYYITNIFKRSVNLNKINTTIINQIPQGSRVLSHSNLVFGGIEKYRIHSTLTFYWTQYYKRGENFNTYLEYAHSLNDEYVVVTSYYTKKEFLKKMDFKNLKNGDKLNNYFVSYIDDEIAVFKLTTTNSN